MEVKFGLISADSHAGFDRSDFLRRMSAARWGDRIPCVVEVEEKGRRIDRWSVYGVPRRNDVANCPALMGEPSAGCCRQATHWSPWRRMTSMH